MVNFEKKIKGSIKVSKGRQGRSKEVRLKKEIEKKNWKTRLEGHVKSFSVCEGCGGSGDMFVEDHHSGDLICVDCGAVNSVGGLSFSEHINTGFSKYCSKPYNRVVHFRQRIAQFICKDPYQKDDDVEKIENYIISKKIPESETRHFGIKRFSNICKKIGLSTKIATHWMQLRKRLNFCPFMDEEKVNPDFLKRLSMRYFCVSRAFELTLRKNKISEPFSNTILQRINSNPILQLTRNNVINLNYTIIQLIRIEDEQFFREVAKYFPPLISHNQPATNNKRWKIIIEYCKKNFVIVTDPVHGDMFSFSWEYKPIVVGDLLRYFYFFH